jgi:hypothetical protein
MKIPCKSCGREIIKSTADITENSCFDCWKESAFWGKEKKHAFNNKEYFSTSLGCGYTLLILTVALALLGFFSGGEVSPVIVATFLIFSFFFLIQPLYLVAFYRNQAAKSFTLRALVLIVIVFAFGGFGLVIAIKDAILLIIGSSLVLGLLIWALIEYNSQRNRCPHCHKEGALKEEDRFWVDEVVTEKTTESVTHRDRYGKVIGYSDVPAKKNVTEKVNKTLYVCSICKGTVLKDY